MAEGADDIGPSDEGDIVVMLVTMQKQPGRGALDVMVKRDKTQMHLVIAIMDEPGRIVCQEDVHGRERCQLRLHLFLFVHEMTSGFVFP